MSDVLEWMPVSGWGVVNSFTVVYLAPPGFEDQLPYVVALVDLDEGVRMMTRLIGCSVGDVRIGMPVQVEFTLLEKDDISLPTFRLARNRASGS